MPFTAQFQNHRVDATVFPIDVWNDLKVSTEKHDLLCPDPECDVQMIPKTYTRTGTQFFAHKVESQCHASGMTEEHLLLQRRIQKAAADSGWTAKMEVYLPELRHEKKRYVDVLATSPDDPDCRIAFEIQWSHQTPEAYIERTQSYAERGIRTYWISKRKVEQDCFDEGVCNFVLSEDCEGIFFDPTSTHKLPPFQWGILNMEINSGYQLDLGAYGLVFTSIKDFIQKVLVIDGAYLERCDFFSDFGRGKCFHFCKGLDCAIEYGNSRDKIRQQNIDDTIDELIKFISKWCPYKKINAKRLEKILDHVSQKENLPDVRHILEGWYEKGFIYSDVGEKRWYFDKAYAPPTLPQLCRWLWKSDKLYEKMTRTTAYDPRLDYDFWLCDCDWKHLEIGYRIFDRTKPNRKPSRVSVVRCAKCGAMNGGAGPHKKRIKPQFLRNAKQYDYGRGKGTLYP